MTSYGGFEIERRGSLWHAVRRTRTAIWRLSPKRSRMEIEAAIREHLASLSTEELFAL